LAPHEVRGLIRNPTQPHVILDNEPSACVRDFYV
jgi:hypothetical protein